VYMGGKGAISVIGIAYPAEFSQMVRLGLEGKVAEANQLHYGLLPKIGLAFKEGNPIGIKAILAAKGLCEPYVRLPLVEASAELKKEVAANVQF
jgi:dihydrodipicolinate synthase